MQTNACLRSLCDCFSARSFGGAICLLVAFIVAGCATAGASPGPTIGQLTFTEQARPASPSKGMTVAEWSAVVFVHDLVASAASPEDEDLAVKAFRTGKAFLDHHCNAYMNTLGNANQAASNERKQIGIIGGLVSALMGLTGSDAKDIAIAAATLSFTASSRDAFTSTFLFSDAANSITSLVGRAQRAYLKSVEGDLAILDYSATVALLAGYERLCRPAEIRRLIDESVAEASLKVPNTTKPLASPQEVASLLEKLTKDLGRPVSEAEAITLFAWFSKPGRRAEVKSGSPFITSLLAALGDNDAALESKVQNSLLPIGVNDDPIALRWSASVNAVPGALPTLPKAAAVGAPAPAVPSAQASRMRALISAPTVNVRTSTVGP